VSELYDTRPDIVWLFNARGCLSTPLCRCDQRGIRPSIVRLGGDEKIEGGGMLEEEEEEEEEE